MKVTKVALFGHVPAGTQVWLTKEQARDRAHSISPTDSNKSVKDRKLFTANDQLGFKGGEELAIESDLDRGLEVMFGIAPASADDKAADKLAAVEKKVSGIKAQIEAETAAVAAATDDAGRSKAQGKLDKAKGALSKAEAELAKLQG
ncbi:hypothetical protein [Devosia sp. Root635]|uniref:hypothetical protein n=1 Tax=Devosia sp. Root635 TaxID=1736575 RepID=UPI000700AEDE|nr:hypothetical protein [Devosia sp. Root635]KRA44694.1 hypothetical protein ASD80_06010 [Devosia sp. Root635]